MKESITVWWAIAVMVKVTGNWVPRLFTSKLQADWPQKHACL